MDRKKMKEEAERFMTAFPRSNFPSDQSIAERFGLNRVTVNYLRHKLISKGKLKFNNKYFIPNDTRS